MCMKAVQEAIVGNGKPKYDSDKAMIEHVKREIGREFATDFWKDQAWQDRKFEASFRKMQADMRRNEAAKRAKAVNRKR